MSVSLLSRSWTVLPCIAGLPPESQPAAVCRLADNQLLHRLGVIHAQGQVNTAEELVHIIEVQRRGLHRTAACSSIYVYCIRHLQMSKSEAFWRIRAARVGRRFPFVLEAIAAGRLSLTAIAMLAPHIKSANARELTEAASHRSIKDLKLLLAERFPRADRPTVMRAIILAVASNSLPLAASLSIAGADTTLDGMQNMNLNSECKGPVTEVFSKTLVPSDSSQNADEMGPLLSHDAVADMPTDSVASAATHIASQIVATLSSTDAPVVPPQVVLLAVSQVLEQAVSASGSQSELDAMARADLSPLARDRWCWQFTVDQESQDLLEQAMCFSTAVGTAAAAQEALKNALRCYVAECRKLKFAQVANPRSRTGNAHGRHIPAHIQRAVSERDNYQCTFRSADGTRCDEKRALEFDHVRPVAAGGATTLENLRLLCRPHNELEAERAFGADHVANKIRESRAFKLAQRAQQEPPAAHEP